MQTVQTMNLTNLTLGSLNIQLGSNDPKLLVICDAPSQLGHESGDCMTPKQRARLISMLGAAADEGVAFLSPCLPIPEAISENERLAAEHIEKSAPEFIEAVKYFLPSIKCIVTLGKNALRQAAGKAIKITTARGSFHKFERTGDVPVMPVQSMANLFIRPQIAPIVESDLRQVTTLAENAWEYVEGGTAEKLDYKWSLDLSEWLANPPPKLVVDTETLGYIWFNRKAILTVQLCRKEGEAVIVPFNLDYWNNDALRGETTRHLPKLTPASLAKLQKQVKQLLGNPAVAVCGHNFKFDAHHFRQYGIEIADWRHDTLQLAFTVDENMRQKNLDEATRRWVPALAGYADAFNADPTHVGKSRMDLVPHDKMIQYGCGDVDACMRLSKILLTEAKKDMRNYTVYEKVKMPAIRHVFFNHAERYGLPVDKVELKSLGESLASRCEVLERELLREAAEKWPAVLRRHEAKGLKFSRPDFVRDLLFAPDGMFLESIVATKKTRKLALDEQLESTSKKDHLPYFSHIPWVAKYMDYATLATLIKSFMGRESSEQWLVVPQLKNGGYGKRIVSAFEESGKAIPQGPRRVRTIGTADAPAVLEPDPDTIFIHKGVTYGTSRGRVLELNEEAAKGFWWYLENIDPNALHPSFGLDVAVTGRSNCVDGDTLVPCRDGVRPMREVKVGHEVWTHAGRWKPVTYKWELGEEPMYDVHFTNGNILRCSERHALLADRAGWTLLRHACIHKALGRPFSEDERDVPISQLAGDMCETLGSAGGWGYDFTPSSREGKESGLVSIEKVVPVGSRQVFDIAVEDDASYECCGVFSHNCREPNLQNIPKRGEEAMSFRKIFKAPPGWTFIECDESQAELRVIACMAKETNMLDIYRKGGDIHAMTGQRVSGLTDAQWKAAGDKKRKDFRQLAKAVNFGFCIAKGQRVLTNEGLVPIEEVKDCHLLWDGVEWVQHDGVIYKGRKKVIRWDGLTATPEHKVWTEGRVLPLRVAASEGRAIVRTATNAGTPIVWDAYAEPWHDPQGGEVLGSGRGLQSVQKPNDAGLQQPGQRSDIQLSMPEGKEVPGGCEGECARPKVRCDGAEMPKVDTSIVQTLQGPRNRSTVRVTEEFCAMGTSNLSEHQLQGSGIRQNKQRRTLRTEQPSTNNSEGECEEWEEVEVYDIMNAGPRHRFTCEGCLVSNCFGMWWRKFVAYAKTSYGVTVTDREAERAREVFFNLFPGLARYHDSMRKFVTEHKYVRSLHGALRRLPDVDSVEEGTRKEAERQAINSPVQGFSSDLGLIGATLFADGCDPNIMRVLGFIHDATVLLVRTEHAREAAGYIKWCMQNQPLEEMFDLTLPVPIVADVSMGTSLAEMEEQKDIEPVRPPWVLVG